MGERRTLTLEYIGLIMVFGAYAFVENPWFAVGLYIVDHLFFAMAIAMKTYFQKIADPADMAPTAGVAFSINHIAAVVIPALFGLMWLVSPSAVFWPVRAWLVFRWYWPALFLGTRWTEMKRPCQFLGTAHRRFPRLSEF